jgi:hypothetical protein
MLAEVGSTKIPILYTLSDSAGVAVANCGVFVAGVAVNPCVAPGAFVLETPAHAASNNTASAAEPMIANLFFQNMFFLLIKKASYRALPGERISFSKLDLYPENNQARGG